MKLSVDQILEGNKLIAVNDGRIIGIGIPLNTYNFYHTKMDKLMPVVEKICRTKIEWENSNDVDFYYLRTFGMMNEAGKMLVRFNGCALFHSDTLPEALWLAVVDWFKNVKPNNEQMCG